MEFAKLPQHVAFIMDGNGRWAQGRRLARLEGHRKGIDTVERIVEEAARLKIPYVTFYAFSTENWRRPEDEVSGLFNLMREFFRSRMAKLHEKGVKVKFIGNRLPAGAPGPGRRLPEDILKLMADVEEETAQNTAVTALFAINYSGRDELLRAIAFMGEEMQAGKLFPWNVDEATVAKYLDTAGVPDPDLIIRTSGEQRISNYLLWQMAYSELLFHEASWPSFTIADFHECLSAYVGRDRRFGGLNQNAPEDDEVVEEQ